MWCLGCVQTVGISDFNLIPPQIRFLCKCPNRIWPCSDRATLLTPLTGCLWPSKNIPAPAKFSLIGALWSGALDLVSHRVMSWTVKFDRYVWSRSDWDASCSNAIWNFLLNGVSIGLTNIWFHVHCDCSDDNSYNLHGLKIGFGLPVRTRSKPLFTTVFLYLFFEQHSINV